MRRLLTTENSKVINQAIQKQKTKQNIKGHEEELDRHSLLCTLHSMPEGISLCGKKVFCDDIIESFFSFRVFAWLLFPPFFKERF